MSLVVAIARATPAGVQLLGTGFSIASNLVATNAHVVGVNHEGLVAVFPKLAELSDYQDTTDSSVQTAPLELEAVDPLHDLCVLRTQLPLQHPFELSGTDEVEVGTLVEVFSFPHAPNGRLVLTRHLSWVGARVLLPRSSLAVKHLVLNTQSRPGESGAPVVNTHTGNVVAVIRGAYVPGPTGISLGGIDPQTLHQTTHAVSSHYLDEMMRDA